MFGLKKYRRKKIIAKPFPHPWLNILQRDVAWYQKLNQTDRAELRRHIQIFLAEKPFEGCRGLVVMDYMRLIIAANACILLLHRKTDYYPHLPSILIYPAAFIVERKNLLPGGIIAQTRQVLLGESWHHGSVVLSWAQIRYDNRHPSDGKNVIFHEFAHQIDSSFAREDNSTILKNTKTFNRWAKSLGDNYRKHRKNVTQGQKTTLDRYAATNPAEFFAVATEVFFESPKKLKNASNDLYQRLAEFYCQNPADDER
jgi:hypothetical protein